MTAVESQNLEISCRPSRSFFRSFAECTGAICRVSQGRGIDTRFCHGQEGDAKPSFHRPTDRWNLTESIDASREKLKSCDLAASGRRPFRKSSAQDRLRAPRVAQKGPKTCHFVPLLWPSLGRLRREEATHVGRVPPTVHGLVLHDDKTDPIRRIAFVALIYFPQCLPRRRRGDGEARLGSGSPKSVRASGGTRLGEGSPSRDVSARPARSH